MSRYYRCLECGLTVPGRLRASMHVRNEHGEQLEDRHVGEFVVLVSGEGVEEPSTRVPPFWCRHCLDGQGAASHWGGEEVCRKHIAAAHDLFLDRIQYGTDYISKLDLEAEAAAEEAEFARQIELCLPTLYSMRGVADFLTECERADEGA